MSDSKRAITFDRVIRVIATLAIIAVAVWLIGILSNVLLPFCVACIISYLLEPVVEFQQKHLKLRHRSIPVFLTLLEAALIFGILAYFFYPFCNRRNNSA